MTHGKTKIKLESVIVGNVTVICADLFFFFTLYISVTFVTSSLPSEPKIFTFSTIRQKSLPKSGIKNEKFFHTSIAYLCSNRTSEVQTWCKESLDNSTVKFLVQKLSELSDTLQ